MCATLTINNNKKTHTAEPLTVGITVTQSDFKKKKEKKMSNCGVNFISYAERSWRKLSESGNIYFL